jgi:hypothetical protein
MSGNYICSKWAKNIEKIHKSVLVGGMGDWRLDSGGGVCN